MQIRSFKKMRQEQLHFMEGFEGNEELVHPDDSKILVNKSSNNDNASISKDRESMQTLKMTRSAHDKRKVPRMLSQRETSDFESMSNPGTTASLKDIFDIKNEVEDNSLLTQIERHIERSQSVEGDLKAIREAGGRLMRSSTQGYQLLWARAKFDAVTPSRRNSNPYMGYDTPGRDDERILCRSLGDETPNSPLI